MDAIDYVPVLRKIWRRTRDLFDRHQQKVRSRLPGRSFECW